LSEIFVALWKNNGSPSYQIEGSAAQEPESPFGGHRQQGERQRRAKWIGGLRPPISTVSGGAVRKGVITAGARARRFCRLPPIAHPQQSHRASPARPQRGGSALVGSHRQAALQNLVHTTSLFILTLVQWVAAGRSLMTAGRRTATRLRPA
jgi:hypothetical protein